MLGQLQCGQCRVGRHTEEAVRPVRGGQLTEGALCGAQRGPGEQADTFHHNGPCQTEITRISTVFYLTSFYTNHLRLHT